MADESTAVLESPVKQEPVAAPTPPTPKPTESKVEPTDGKPEADEGFEISFPEEDRKSVV